MSSTKAKWFSVGARLRGFILCRAINAMTAKKSSDARGRRRLTDSDKLTYPCWER